MKTLKLLRKQEDKTQVEMAEILEISPQRYNMYENDRRKLPVKIAKKAADYFGVTLEDIFFGTNLNNMFNKKVD